MGFKLKIGKIKISAKNPVKAIVKAVTAPLVAPTVGAISLVSKKEAVNVGEKLGLNKDDVAGINIGTKAVIAVGAPIALSSLAASVPAAAAVKTTLEKTKETEQEIIQPVKEEIKKVEQVTAPLKDFVVEAKPEQLITSVEPVIAPSTFEQSPSDGSSSRQLDWLEQLFADLARLFK